MNRSHFLIGSTASTVAFFDTAREAMELRKTVATEKLQSDLRLLWSAMIEVGADPFHTTNQSTLEAAYASTLQAIDQPLTTGEFYLRTAALFAQLNDGHVDVVPGDALQYAQSGGAFFPLLIGIDDRGLYVRGENDTVPIGSRVVAIDNRSEAQILQLLLSVVGGQTKALVRQRARSRLPIILYELDGPRSAYSCTFQQTSGSATTVTLPAKLFSNSATTARPYAYTTLANGKVGYIDYRQCVDANHFSDFLEETFSSISRNGVRSLVIDVRSNSGGSSQLNDELWRYVSDKPFKQFGGFARRSSDRLKREYGREKYTAIYGDDAWRAPNGTYLEYHSELESDLMEPGTNPLRFQGRAVLLIGSGTLSSAMSCAVAAKDYELATIVGEETAEPVVTTGEIYAVTAPETGLRCTFTTKIFFGPRPRPDGQGVIPDINVHQTPPVIGSISDSVLERGIAVALES
jgi:hypothetical protein